MDDNQAGFTLLEHLVNFRICNVYQVGLFRLLFHCGYWLQLSPALQRSHAAPDAAEINEYNRSRGLTLAAAFSFSVRLLRILLPRCLGSEKALLLKTKWLRP